LLCIPGGAGLVALASALPGSRPRALGLAVAVVVAGVSIAAPTAGMAEVAEAGALSNRAAAWLKQGRAGSAEAELKRALELDPDCIPALRLMNDLLIGQGRTSEFDEYDRRATAAQTATPVERWTNAVLLRVAAGEPGSAWQTVLRAQREGVELDPELLDLLADEFRRAGRSGPANEGAQE
jgi:predicted Zn-dependent protease